MVEVWNKIDNLPDNEAEAYRTASQRDTRHCVTSAITGEGLEELYEVIDSSLSEPVFDEKLNLSYAEGNASAWLFSNNVGLGEEQTDEGYVIDVRWSEKTRNQYTAANG